MAFFDAKEPTELSFLLICCNQSFENENHRRLQKSAVHTHSLYKTFFFYHNAHIFTLETEYFFLPLQDSLLSDCEIFPLRESNIYLNKPGFEA